MKYYLVPENGNPEKLVKIGNTQPPANGILIPRHLWDEDEADLTVSYVTNEEGIEETIVTLDQTKKDARLLLELEKQTEMLWSEMRSKRNQLLQETDYLMLPDISGDKTDIISYRQTLRDLPEAIEDITNFEWPVKP